MKKISYLIGCVLLLHQLNGENLVRDSLEAIVTTQTGLEKIATLINLSNEVVYASPKEAIRFANQAMTLAKQANELDHYYKALKARGYANGYAGNISASMTDMQTGLEYYQSIRDSIKIAEALSDLGYLHQSQGSYDRALEMFQASLSMREKIADQKGIAYSQNNIGALYWRLEKQDEALKYYQMAIAFFETSGMKEEIAITSNNIGEIFSENGDYSKAFEYFKRALSLNRELDHRIFEAKNLNSIGKLLLRQKQITQAIKYFNQAISIQKLCGDIEGNALSEYLLGQAYTQQYNFLLANERFSSSIQLAEQIQANDLLIKSLFQSAETHYKLKNYQAAYETFYKAKVLNDSIFNLKKNQSIEELKARFETERHILENMSLKLSNNKNEIIIRQHRTLLIMTLILSLSIVLMIWLFLQKKQSAGKLKTLELEQKLLRSQMNPHFIFNTLTVIQNNILQNTIREGVNLISSLAILIRLTLDNSSNEFVPFEKEVQSLQLYLMLQQQRYGKQFSFELKVDSDIHAPDFSVPPMLTQPFVENAIEHGFGDIDHPGLIRIQYELADGGLMCEVEDNGIGYESGIQKKKNTTDHYSYGIEITRQRVEILRKKFKLNARVEIIDKIHSNDTGTLVRIFMPIKQR